MSRFQTICDKVQSPLDAQVEYLWAEYERAHELSQAAIRAHADAIEACAEAERAAHEAGKRKARILARYDDLLAVQKAMPPPQEIAVTTWVQASDAVSRSAKRAKARAK